MPDRDLIPTDSILYNSRIIGSLIWKELQSSPSSGLSTKEGSGSGGMRRPREAKLSGRGTALPSCSCVTLDPVFPLLTSKTKQKFGFLHVHMKISLSFGNSVTKLPYPSSYLLPYPPTTHTQTENQKLLCRSHKCLWFPFTLSVAILVPMVWSSCLLSKMRKWRPRKEK